MTNRTPPWCDPRFNLTDRHVDLIAHAWRKLIHDNGLEILATETKVVNDHLRLAGTLDRIVRLGQDLTFDGVTIPKGTIVVLDIKTSTLHADHNGIPSYWSDFPLQIYAYMTSVPYDTATDTRGEWGFDIDRHHALIAHFDVDTLYETGQAVWQLIYVDTTDVHKGVTAIAMAEQYHQAPKFKMAATTSTLGEPCDTTPPSSSEQRRTDLLERYQQLNYTDQETFRALGLDKDDLDAIEAAIAEREVDPFDRVVPPPEKPAPNPQPVVEPDLPIDTHSVNLLIADIKRSPQRDTINQWATQAVTAGLSIDPRVHPTYRHYLLLTAAWQIAEACGDDADALMNRYNLAEPVGEMIARLTIDQALDLIASCDTPSQEQPEQTTLLD